LRVKSSFATTACILYFSRAAFALFRRMLESVSNCQPRRKEHFSFKKQKEVGFYSSVSKIINTLKDMQNA
jgi:hypothetical protein